MTTSTPCTLAKLGTDALVEELRCRGMNPAVYHEAVAANVKKTFKRRRGLDVDAATAWKAVRRSDDHPFAIREIDKATDAFENTALHIELGILRTLHHKNMVNLHQVFESESQMWLVMELITGGPLRDHMLQQNPYSE